MFRAAAGFIATQLLLLPKTVAIVDDNPPATRIQIHFSKNAGQSFDCAQDKNWGANHPQHKVGG